MSILFLNILTQLAPTQTVNRRSKNHHQMLHDTRPVVYRGQYGKCITGSIILYNKVHCITVSHDCIQLVRLPDRAFIYDNDYKNGDVFRNALVRFWISCVA